MKILFLHNTLAAYRVPFFNELSKLCDLTIMFYNLEDNIRIYNDIDRVKELDHRIKIYKVYDKKILNDLLEDGFDCIVLPPLDDLISIKISRYLISKKNTTIAMWWGKWIYRKSALLSKKWIKDLIHSLALKVINNDIDLYLSYGSKSKEYLISEKISKSKIFNFTNSTEINYGASDLIIRDEYKINNSQKIVLFMGRIVERKGVDILINAFLNIPNEDLHLLICGDGPDLDTLMNKYCFRENITFTGQIQKKNISNFYSQSDIFVIPSYLHKNSVEPWGLTVNEAQQFNLPIIATTAVGAAYDLINSKNGIIIEQNNIKELEDALIRLSDSSITKEMVRVNKYEHSPKTMASRCFNAISQISKGNKFEQN